MPLRNYGLLYGNLVEHGPQSGGNPHYLLIIDVGAVRYRVAVNLGQDLLFKWVPKFASEPAKKILARIKAEVDRKGRLPGFWLKTDDAPTLDFVHGLPVKASEIKDSATPTAKLDAIAKRTKQVAVFGTGYPDQDDRPAAQFRSLGATDPRRASFGFDGVDNIHMNQGNHLRIGTHLDRHFQENGPAQDGGVLFYLDDGTVTGFFSRFAGQSTETDRFGNPTRGNVEALNRLPAAVRSSLIKPNPFAHLADLKAAPGDAIAPRAVSAQTPRQRRNVAQAAPQDMTPATRTSANLATPGRIFADPAPPDPKHVFEPDIDDDVRNSPDSKKFGVYGVPEPVPGPRDNKYPTMNLSDVIDTRAITASGQIAFHSVGDTGAPKASALTHEVAVADMMVAQLTGSGPRDPTVPAFFFHLGDVVYFYGEQEYYYDQFAEPFKDYDRPIFAIPGNHDAITYKDDMVSLEAFIAAFCADAPGAWAGFGGVARSTMDQPGVYFTLDAPFVSIIGLYSNASESFGFLDDQQKLFLFNELTRLKPLKQADGRAVIVAVHHPPVSASTKKPSSSTMRDDMDAACNHAGFWPDAVFSGHAHLYQRLTRTVSVDGKDRQIPYIVCGAGGYGVSNLEVASWRKAFQQKDLSDPKFLLHKLVPEYGFLKVLVTGATNGTGATLRTEYWTPRYGLGQPADVCVVDLATHTIV